jgi:probable rRNA maturation factor
MTLSLEWIDEREGGAGAREEQWMELLEKLLHIAGRKEEVTDGIVTLTLTDDEGIR